VQIGHLHFASSSDSSLLILLTPDAFDCLSETCLSPSPGRIIFPYAASFLHDEVSTKLAWSISAILDKVVAPQPKR